MAESAATDLVAEFLTHLEKERDVSPNTVTAYARDLADLQQFLSTHLGVEQLDWAKVDRLAMR